ncbi:MAG: ABC transporter substrate-binding protein [Akkermansiaceae bacterium]|nr:ABC transporter substrate-binding protein [Akkermansiaceae bacterium]
MPSRENSMLSCLMLALCVGSLGILCSCQRDEDVVERGLGFEQFQPVYNRYIKNWLQQQKVATEKAIIEANKELAELDDPQLMQTRRDALQEIEKEMEVIDFRIGLGDYFADKKPEDIPDDLVWEDGMDEPEIGDPSSMKGGVFRTWMPQFPATVRPFGKESNNSFRGYLYDELEIGLVNLHPLTGKIIPGVAKSWAVSADKRTVYYELDEEARYNDGVKIKARDFQVSAYLRVSDHVTAPYAKQYYREQFAQIAVYSDSLLSVTLREGKPLTPLFASMSPSNPEFYGEYGADYEDRYQWRVPRHTGAYYVKEGDINKGVSIKLTRAKDWWAKDKKYYRYRFNPDHIVYTVIRDENKAFELFRAGQLDAFFLTRPDYWYEKSEIPQVFDGYIERYKFYTQYPRVPRGIYMNVSRPKLDDRDVRLGLQHALNWRMVIDVMFRGDFSRLQGFSQGFGEYTNPAIKARPYSVTRAREYFNQAGYTEEGSDGVLRKPSGERLSVVLSFGNSPTASKLCSLLKEEAKKAGVDLILDGQENTVFYKTVMKKEHDMAFWGWGSRPPFPSYYQFFYSKNAFDEKGKPKPQTNNINSYANEQMDVYAKAMRNAKTLDEMKQNAWAAQELIHKEAFFSPGYATEYVRIGTWRWVRWPDTKDTPFNVPVVREPFESYVLWIDPKYKRETENAMRSGDVFSEVYRVIDVFKDGIPQQQRGDSGE